MSETMRAIAIHNNTGPASALHISTTTAKPVLKPGEILVKTRAFGLNRADTLQRSGAYPPPPGASTVLGLEFSGTIAEVSKERRDDGAGGAEGEEKQRHKHHAWKVGDAVLGLTYGGAYASYIAVDSRMLIRKPSAMSFETAAGVCEAWFTALQALHLVGAYEPSRVKSVLWHAGASSVSIAGIQLSLHALKHFHGHLGAGAEPPKVFVTARSDEKCSWLKKEFGVTGAVNPLNAPEGKWADVVKGLNGGEGVDLVVDYIGASYFQENLKVLARDGRVVQLGNMGGTKLPDGTDMGMFLMKRVRWEGSTLRSRDPVYQGKLRDLFEEKCLEDLTNGTLKWDLEKVMSWKDVGKAHELMESNQTKGKIVCVVD